MSTLSITKQEGSARPATPANRKALIIGPASSGIKENKIYTFANPGDVNTSLGYGPAVDAAQLVMSRAPSGFGSVDVIVSSASIGSSLSQIVNPSPQIDFSEMDANGPNNRYDFKVEITKAGALGTSFFKYSLDGGQTYSPELKTTSSFVFPNTNVSATFAAGTHVVGSVAHATSSAPMLNSSDLAACFDVLDTQNNTPTLILVAADSANPEECANLFATVDTKLTDLNSKYKFTQAVLPAGGETYLFGRDTAVEQGAWTHTEVISEAQDEEASEGNFIQYVAERVNTTHPLPRVGWSRPRLPFAYAVAAEQHATGLDYSALISANGLNYVSNPSYDDFANGTVYLSENVVAPRTWIGEAGIFLNQSLLKGNPISTYNFWPKGRVANVAAAVMKNALRPFINTRVRVLSDGTGRIDERDANKIETTVSRALRDALLTPTNGQGFRGHVSSFRFSVNGETNLLSTGLLQTTLEIVPLGYITDITGVITLTDSIQVDAA